MKLADVKVGGVYWKKISGKLAPVKLTEERERRTRRGFATCFLGRNLRTGRPVHVGSAQSLRSEILTSGYRVNWTYPHAGRQTFNCLTIREARQQVVSLDEKCTKVAVYKYREDGGVDRIDLDGTVLNSGEGLW